MNVFTIEIPQPDYTIRIQCSATGYQTVYFNDEQVAKRRMWGRKITHTFARSVAGTPVTVGVHVRLANLTTYHARVEVDGREIHSANHSSTGSLDQPVPAKPGTWAHGLPGWAMLFILPCAFIPFFTLGGAIPAMIGFTGAYGCIKTSKKPWKLRTRVATCLAITVGMWLFLLLLHVTVAPVTQRWAS